MEISNPEEQYPEHIRSLRRYWRDCLDAKSYDELLMRASSYLDAQLGENSTLATEELIKALDTLYLNEVFFDLNKMQSIERFLLVPLLTLGPMIRAIMPSEDIEEWYTEAVRAPLKATIQTPHSIMCTKEPNPENGNECSHSYRCPVLTIRSALITEPLDPDFDSIDYLVYGKDQVKLNVFKVHLAYDRGVITPEEYSQIVLGYQDKYEDYIQKLQFTDGI